MRFGESTAEIISIDSFMITSLYVRVFFAFFVYIVFILLMRKGCVVLESALDSRKRGMLCVVVGPLLGQARSRLRSLARLCAWRLEGFAYFVADERQVHC